MKVNVIKEHYYYALGEHDIADERARYLIRAGVAEPVTFKQLAEAHGVSDVLFTEKQEKPKAKEKKENKTGNVPTAKKKK